MADVPGTATSRGRGRPPAATPDEVVAAAEAQFARCERVDVSVLSDGLGTSRMSIHRWFGSREGLIGEMLARNTERILRGSRARAAGSGPHALLDTFDATNRTIAASVPLRDYLRREGAAALRVLTSSEGLVQPRAVACVDALIREEADATGWVAPADPATLAFAIVRLAEAFIYSDSLIDIRGDVDRLRDIEAVLLGVA